MSEGPPWGEFAVAARSMSESAFSRRLASGRWLAVEAIPPSRTEHLGSNDML
jgi:hypothetical protein